MKTNFLRQTFWQSSREDSFKHIHLQFDLSYLCSEEQSFSVILHWHLQLLCSGTLTWTFPKFFNFVDPTTYWDFEIVYSISSWAVGKQLSNLWVQQPPHLLTTKKINLYFCLKFFTFWWNLILKKSHLCKMDSRLKDEMNFLLKFIYF